MRVQVVLTVRPYRQPAAREVPLVRQKIAFNPVSPQLCAAVSPTLVAGGGAAAARGGPEPGAGAADAAPAAAAAGGGARSGGKLGYIRVSTFNKQTGEGVRAALEQLRAGGAERCGAPTGNLLRTLSEQRGARGCWFLRYALHAAAALRGARVTRPRRAPGTCWTSGITAAGCSRRA